jgi:hypothetical protein
MGRGGREPIHLADGSFGWVSDGFADGPAAALTGANQGVASEQADADTTEHQHAKRPIRPVEEKAGGESAPDDREHYREVKKVRTDRTSV